MPRLKDQMNAMPDIVGRVLTGFVLIPIVAVRLAIIAFVLALWLIHAPRMTALVLSSVELTEKKTDEKRTPSTNRSLRKLIEEIDDVRVRVSEHKKQEPEPWRFRIYKIDGEYRRACSPPNTTTCD